MVVLVDSHRVDTLVDAETLAGCDAKAAGAAALAHADLGFEPVVVRGDVLLNGVLDHLIKVGMLLVMGNLDLEALVLFLIVLLQLLLGLRKVLLRLLLGFIIVETEVVEVVLYLSELLLLLVEASKRGEVIKLR